MVTPFGSRTLPDESILVRTGTHSVHLDVSSDAIHVRAPLDDEDGLEGILLASYPMDSAQWVGLMRERPAGLRLWLRLKDGSNLDLGVPPSEAIGARLAKTVAQLTGCQVDIATQPLKPPSLPPSSPRSNHGGPVFAALINESQRARPEPSRAVTPTISSELEEDDEAQTAELTSSSGRSRQAALVELLALASSHLPIATPDLPTADFDS